MIVVTAATGAYGQLVVEELLTRVAPDEVAVAVRDRNKAERWARRGVHVRRGDYDDEASMRAALTGAEHVLFISSPELDSAKRIPQHKTVIRAAKEAEVGHILYTSFLGADLGEAGGPIAAVHHATEQAIRDSGLTHTFLRHPFYSEVFINASLRGVVEAGELVSSTQGKRINGAPRADLAAAAAAVLASKGHEGKVYELTGAGWTYPQLAEALSRVSGKPVAYREVTDEDVPPQLAWLFALVRSGATEQITHDYELLAGRPPSSVDDLARAALDASGD
jgi:NAD(P)H dehydrogenase (quinone)